MLSNLRLAILSSDDAHHKYLVNYFNNLFNIVLVVIEPAKYQRGHLLKRKKYIDYYYSIYHKLRRDICGLNRYRRKYFNFSSNVTIRDTHIVKNINDNKVKKLLLTAEPDLTIIMCTSILESIILDTASPIINIHGGYLPYYRGNHCFFFAMYNGDYNKIGSTIHYVDKGIDTGDVIATVIPPIYTSDTPEKLYCRAEKMAIEKLSTLLIEYSNGNPLPRKPQISRYKLYKSRDRNLLREIIYIFKRIVRHGRQKQKS